MTDKEKLEICKLALECIKRHQETICSDKSYATGAYAIAKNALEEIKDDS